MCCKHYLDIPMTVSTDQNLVMTNIPNVDKKMSIPLMLNLLASEWANCDTR